jgi:predicted ATPase/DNA-binding CsgD family transcriptional regulator
MRIVGREHERARLAAALKEPRIVLVSGEAGVGKSRLLAEVATVPGMVVLRGAPVQGGTAPFGPLVAALRSYLQLRPDGLEECGPLRAQLALLLPELGVAAEADRMTLFEAIRCALASIAARHRAVVILDDLQWSDEATLEVLAALSEPPLPILAAYRSDGLPRQHGIRRLRHELRRAARLEEIALAPLGPVETAALLAQALGERPSPELARAIHERTEGLPFFVEELAAATRRCDTEDVPLPDTVRDAVLVRVSELSEEGRAAVEVAAVAGETFELEIVAALSSEHGLQELLEVGLVREGPPAGFRHGLAQEALYSDVPWMRRRTLHRALGEALEREGAQSREIATHWLGARDAERARAAFLRAAAESEAVHAFRDAAEAGRQALDLWPDSGDDERRAEALERYARCCQPAGELAEAARAWRELVALRAGDARGTAAAQRGLAAIHELRGDREAAVAARSAAAAAFLQAGSPADAAVERIAIANQRRLAARHGEAVELARAARADADRAGRLDLRLRALGIEGMAQAKHGEYEQGLEIVRNGLALALEHELTAVAAELYQRLSVTLYDSADYRSAQQALGTALELCRTDADASVESACVTCMAYVLRERGEWGQAAEICREMLADGSGVFVAEALLGAIHAHEGKLASARRLLSSSLAVASRIDHYNMTIDATVSLGRVAAAAGDDEEAAERCRALLAHWDGSDDHHYAVGGLRWAAAFFARRGDRAGAQACADALTRMASATGHADALAALAHAIAETALLEGDASTAAVQLARALELHGELDMPFERAEIELRAGVALAAAGEREAGLQRLAEAHRTARRLGARPLASEAAQEVTALGESVISRLGTRAVADSDGTGLSKREREVVRLVAAGRTNREIAQELYLSPRTVDMHVRNILRKLDCRSRVQAAGRAREIGLAA